MTILRMHGYVSAPANADELTHRCRVVREAAFRDTADRLSVVYIGSAGFEDLLAALSPGDVVYAYLTSATGRDQWAALDMRGAKVRIVADRRVPAGYVSMRRRAQAR
jgi:hypothetical protein